MSDGWETFWWVVIVMLAISLIGDFVGWQRGKKDGIKQVQVEAIQHGYGSYVLDNATNTTTHFQWK